MPEHIAQAERICVDRGGIHSMTNKSGIAAKRNYLTIQCKNNDLIELTYTTKE